MLTQSPACMHVLLHDCPSLALTTDHVIPSTRRHVFISDPSLKTCGMHRAQQHEKEGKDEREGLGSGRKESDPSPAASHPP